MTRYLKLAQFNSRIDKFAEQHYNKPTKAERKLYQILTKNKINFETKKVISSRYIADFYLPEWNLIIEADGDHHLLNKKQRKHDKLRHSFLKYHKLFVLRIRNKVIITHRKQIMNIVREAIIRIASLQTKEMTGYKQFYIKTSKTGWYVNPKSLKFKSPRRSDTFFRYLYDPFIYKEGRNDRGGLTALINKYITKIQKYQRKAPRTFAASSKGITA